MSRKASPTSLVKAKSRVPVAAVVMVVEDAAHAARLAAMRQQEIFVGPFLVFADTSRDRSRRRPFSAGHGNPRVGWFGCATASRVGLRSAPPPNQLSVVTIMRVFICTAGTCGILHMGDQADAGGPEARILAAPFTCLAKSGEKAPCTVETCTPTFSNSRPRIMPITPPPWSSPGAAGRLPGVADKAAGRAGIDCAYRLRLPAPRRPR